MSTQREEILQMLEDAGSRGVSSTEFYNVDLPRFPARIHELKKLGYVIEDESEGRFKRWFLRRSVKCGGPGNTTGVNKCVPRSGAVENISVTGSGGSQVEHESASAAPISGLPDAGSGFPAKLDSQAETGRPGTPCPETVDLPSQDMERAGGETTSPAPSLTLFELPDSPARYSDLEAA